MTTIRDVAAEAGVAVSTVSHALNSTAPVKPETRRRIMDVVRRLNYVPNQAARGLASSRTETIAVLLPPRPVGSRAIHSDMTNKDLLFEICDAASGCGYHVLVVFENPDGEGEELLNVARRKAADGMIIVPRQKNMHYTELIEMDFPFVVMGRVEGEVQCNSIDVDNVVGGYQATEHLIVVGHQRIGIVTPGKSNVLLVRDRIEGYRRALVDYGLDCDPILVKEAVDTVECGYEAAAYFLNLEVPPTAVFCADDSIAIGLISAIQDRGLAVPENMAVVGFGNTLTGVYIRPGLTTIDLPIREISTEATKLLMRQIAFPMMKPKRVVVNTELVIRDSCGGSQRF